MSGAVSQLVDYVTQADHWTGQRGIAHRSIEHLRLSFLAVGAAAVVAVPLAAWLGHVRRGGVVVQWFVNVGRAIPSLAILALLFPLSLRFGFGLGFWPTLPALVALGIPPMFANTYTGVRDVDPAIVESARAMGLRPWQVLLRVELPTSMPLVLAGVRVATLQIIATATLGAYVAFNGLGSFINEGFRQQDDGKLLTGALAVATVALAVDAAFALVVRRASPWRAARMDAPTERITP